MTDDKKSNIIPLPPRRQDDPSYIQLEQLEDEPVVDISGAGAMFEVSDELNLHGRINEQSMGFCVGEPEDCPVCVMDGPAPEKMKFPYRGCTIELSREHTMVGALSIQYAAYRDEDGYEVLASFSYEDTPLEEFAKLLHEDIDEALKEAPPTVSAVKKMVKQLYALAPAGCCLHIVTDDGNIAAGHVDFCIEQAEREDHTQCLEIAKAFRELEISDRAKVLNMQFCTECKEYSCCDTCYECGSTEHLVEPASGQVIESEIISE